MTRVIVAREQVAVLVCRGMTAYLPIFRPHAGLDISSFLAVGVHSVVLQWSVVQVERIEATDAIVLSIR